MKHKQRINTLIYTCFPKDGGLVTINLRGIEQSGKTVFDQRDDITFVLGEGADLNIPIGIELALEKIKLNEKVFIRWILKYIPIGILFPALWH